MRKNIDGILFRKMILSAASLLSKNKDAIDKLNVFPVPDGDTGTNMALTMSSVVKELSVCHANNLTDLCDVVSKGALKGARGNSGVILSQIIKGICEVFASAKTVSTKAVARALSHGSDVAYRAVTKPKEGTMLTVIREMAETAKSLSKKSISMDDFFRGVIDGGIESLKRTPDLLPLLKQAGVVDSGGQGLLFVMQGFYNVVLGREDDFVDFKINFGDEIDFDKMFHVDYADISKIEFAYCTEFFVVNIHKSTTEADIDKFREYLMTIGDCVLVIGDLSLIKVHVHTNEPGLALSNAVAMGEIDGIKIENMLEQSRKLMAQNVKQKDIGMVAVCAGEGLAKIFREMLVDTIVECGQTMNPSANEIAKACDSVHAKNVFVLPNDHNVILACQQAKSIARCNIIVIPTISIPQGLSAVTGFSPDGSVADNQNDMVQAFKSTKSGVITYAVRDTVLDEHELKEGDIIGLASQKVAVKGASVPSVTTQLVDSMVDSTVSNITLYFGTDVAEKEAKELAKELSVKYNRCDVDYHLGGQSLYYYIVSME